MKGVSAAILTKLVVSKSQLHGFYLPDGGFASIHRGSSWSAKVFPSIPQGTDRPFFSRKAFIFRSMISSRSISLPTLIKNAVMAQDSTMPRLAVELINLWFPIRETDLKAGHLASKRVQVASNRIHRNQATVEE